MKRKRVLFIGGLTVGVAGLVAGGAIALAQHRTPPRAVEIGALATPVTTDPTTTDDPIVAAIMLGTVYPTVAQLGTVTADESGYTVRLRAEAGVSADQVTRSLTHSHSAGSAGVKRSLVDVNRVATVDAHTVHITLTRPDSGLPAALSGAAGAVIVADAGQYRIDGFTAGRSLTLTRLRDAGPAQVHWHFYGDAESLRTELAGGRLDLVVPAVDIKLPRGARRVVGPTGPPIVVALGDGHKGDQRLVDAIRSAATTVPAVVAGPGAAQKPLALRTTNEPDVAAAAEAVRRQLAAAGIQATVFTSPPEQWRQLVDAGSYDLAVGTGIDGLRVGTVRYAMIVTARIAGTPRLGVGGALDLSTVRLR
jgi:ABC-type transport system substrate-binding protein